MEVTKMIALKSFKFVRECYFCINVYSKTSKINQKYTIDKFKSSNDGIYFFFSHFYH